MKIFRAQFKTFRGREWQEYDVNYLQMKSNRYRPVLRCHKVSLYTEDLRRGNISYSALNNRMVKPQVSVHCLQNKISSHQTELRSKPLPGTLFTSSVLYYGFCRESELPFSINGQYWHFLSPWRKSRGKWYKKRDTARDCSIRHKLNWVSVLQEACSVR